MLFFSSRMIESLPAVHNHTEERDEGFPEVVPEIGFPIGFKQVHFCYK